MSDILIPTTNVFLHWATIVIALVLSIAAGVLNGMQLAGSKVEKRMEAVSIAALISCVLASMVLQGGPQVSHIGRVVYQLIPGLLAGSVIIVVSAIPAMVVTNYIKKRNFL